MASLNVLQDVRVRPFKNIKTILAVAAGKGGVGKSTVSVNLALSLREMGMKVGLLDADVYGPSLEQMLPGGMEPVNHPENEERLLPGITLGMPFISVAHFRKKASIVRAPIATQIIDQFLHMVEWGELDVLVVDFPPGTGDIQLTLMQKAPLSAAIAVTTPQKVAVLDVRKAIQLFESMHVPLIGVIENMSYLEGEKRLFPFGKGGAESLASEFKIPLLGQLPIDPLLSQCGDEGVSLFEQTEGEALKKEMMKIARLSKKGISAIEREELEVRLGAFGQLEFLIGSVWRGISIHEIQKRCPCAKCEKGHICKKEVSILEFSLIGRYAIKLQFSSGCSQGIYPFSLIKDLLKS